MSSQPLQTLSNVLRGVIDRCVLTKRQEQIFQEELTKHLSDVLQRPEENLTKIAEVLASRGKQSLFEKILRETVTKQERLTKQEAEILDKEMAAALKWSCDYEKAYYGKCWKSEKKRKAFDFLRNWHNVAIYNKESGRLAEDSERLHSLTPLTSALDALDAEFFKGLAIAVQLLNDRIYNSKNPNIGSGDQYLNKWLLEYKLAVAREPAKHSPRELNEQFVSKFHTMTVKKLHEKLHEFHVPHKEEPRGKASPNYGVLLNLPPKRRKTG